MMFVPVCSERCIPSPDVTLQCLQRHFLSKPIDLVRRVRSRPSHGLFEGVHGLSWQLNVTMSGLAVFQLFDVFRLQSETFQIRKLRRIAELTDRKIVRKLAKFRYVRSELQIFFRSRLNINRTKYEYFIRRARFDDLGNRFSVSDCRNLILFQPDIVAKEFEWFDVLGAASGNLHK